MKYYLAVDIGASSGRHILCHEENGRLVLEEVYRFENNVVLKDGHYCWDMDYLFAAILQGMKACRQLNKIPTSMAIDTWAVDYVLLDKNNQRIGDAYAYRDVRCEKGVREVQKLISEEQLYQRTGIQFQKFNTIYQLKADEEVLNRAVDFLMIPDYFNYLLTGKKVNEYTNMSTTQLLDIDTHELDQDLLKKVDIPSRIFQKMVMPTYHLGSLKSDIQKLVGYDLDVIVCATHDTGSAYLASIAKDSLILSSGTWSLLGIETVKPFVNEKTMAANFTNEGGYQYRYRFLKNIMGLWIIQEVARNLNGKYRFDELVELAREAVFDGIFDVNDDCFLKPDNMILEIQQYFTKRNQKVPQSVGEIAYCIYHSLAHCYQRTIAEIEAITKQQYDTINIIGGGCQNELLNEMIAQVTGKKVIAGPIEATALGNILAQLLADGMIQDLNEAREMIRKSFAIKTYQGGSLC